MSLDLPTTLQLLAAWRTNWVDRFDGQYWDANTEEVLAILVATSVLLLAVLGWHLLGSWLHGRFPMNSPQSLFRELCAAHGLDHSDRRLLRTLAAARGVAAPAELFVMPEHFDPDQLPPALATQADHLARLARRLFDVSPDDDRDPGRPL